MTQPLISVVTVVLNGERSLERTIQSVLQQTYPQIEYIIIDGGSTDRTPEIIKSYAPHLAYWVSQPDQGIYDAMNFGIRQATGEWIHLLNADDYYCHRTVLADVVPGLQPDRTNYFSMVLQFSEGQQKVQRFDFQYWKLFVSAFLPHPALIVARSQYEQIGLYDTALKIAADHDLILRLLQVYPALYRDICLVTMAQGGTSAQQLDRSCQEFREVTCRYGLPGWLAQLIYLGKRLAWRRQF